jgi:hypothetical protein
MLVGFMMPNHPNQEREDEQEPDPVVQDPVVDDNDEDSSDPDDYVEGVYEVVPASDGLGHQPFWNWTWIRCEAKQSLARWLRDHAETIEDGEDVVTINMKVPFDNRPLNNPDLDLTLSAVLRSLRRFYRQRVGSRLPSNIRLKIGRRELQNGTELQNHIRMSTDSNTTHTYSVFFDGSGNGKGRGKGKGKGEGVPDEHEDDPEVTRIMEQLQVIMIQEHTWMAQNMSVPNPNRDELRRIRAERAALGARLLELTGSEVPVSLLMGTDMPR